MDGNTPGESPESEMSRPVVEHEYGRNQPASLAVVRAVSALENTDPIGPPNELGFVLYEHISPTALNEIVGDGSGTGDLAVTFTVTAEETYTVTIWDDGDLCVMEDSTDD